mgnify:CR=1 FL=1
MTSGVKSKNLVKLCSSKGIRLAGAESCTGGLVSSLLTRIPGSSAAFLGSVVCYSNSAKEKILKVSPVILTSHGAVSGACAEAMSLGARQLFEADMAFAVTGIAGPSGGSAEKPVGTVWFSLFYRDSVSVWMRRFSGGRRQIQKRAACEILGAMLTALQNPA